MRARFAVTRPDGRSDADVVCDMVQRASPGDTLTFESLRAALQYDGRAFADNHEIGAAVRRAITRMLRAHRRVVHAVPRVGYRVADAGQHVTLADGRRNRATRQMALGVAVLRGVRWDELDANQRQAHEGQLLLMSAMHEATQALARRQTRVERMLATLTAATHGAGT